MNVGTSLMHDVARVEQGRAHEVDRTGRAVGEDEVVGSGGGTWSRAKQRAISSRSGS